MIKKIHLLSITALLTLLLGVAACTENTRKSETDHPPEAPITQKENPQTYTVLTEPDFMPFEFRDDKGKLSGFNIDLMEAIAEKEKIRLDFKTLPFEKLIKAMQEGEYDILAASLTITDERKEILDFSDPYFESRQALLFKKNIHDIKSFSDLKNYKIAVQSETTSEDILKNIMGQNSKNIISLKTSFLGIKETISGRADGVMSDSGVLEYYHHHMGNQLKLFIDPDYPVEEYGIAFTKNRPDNLREKINHGLKTIREDGTYQKLMEKWFGQH